MCCNGEKNEKKINRKFIITFIISAFLFILIGGISGFFIGRGNLQQSIRFTSTDKFIERTIEELERELERERKVSSGLRENSERERAVINRIAESTRQARLDTQSAIPIGLGAADYVQEIINQVAVYNNYVSSIERQLRNYTDLSEN